MIKEAEINISSDPADANAINDLIASMFNTTFCLGAIFGPFLGNILYLKIGAPNTCEYVGYFVIGFGILFFVLCDTTIWNRKEVTRGSILHKSILSNASRASLY